MNQNNRCYHTPHVILDVVTFVYGVGSSSPTIRPGAAHLAEHVIAQFIQSEFHLQVHAETTRDNTSFTIVNPTSEMVRQLADLPKNVRTPFVALKVEDERAVVAAERRQNMARDGYMLGEMVHKRLFGSHPYGESIIGSRSNIQALSVDDVLAVLDLYTLDSVIHCGNLRPDTCKVIDGLPTGLSRGIPVPVTAVSGGRQRWRMREANNVIAWVLPGHSAIPSHDLELAGTVWAARAKQIKTKTRLAIYYRASVLITVGPLPPDAVAHLLTGNLHEEELRHANDAIRLARLRYMEDISDHHRLTTSHACAVNNHELFRQLCVYITPDRALWLSNGLVGDAQTIPIPATHVPQQDVESKRARRSLPQSSTRKTYYNGDSDCYINYVTSPLAQMPHAEIRINALDILTSRDPQYIASARLVVESVLRSIGLSVMGFRYDGWHWLLHVSSPHTSDLENAIVRFAKTLETIEVPLLPNRTGRALSLDDLIKEASIQTLTPTSKAINPKLKWVGATVLIDRVTPTPQVRHFLDAWHQRNDTNLRFDPQKTVRIGPGSTVIHAAAVCTEVAIDTLSMIGLRELAFAASAPFPSLVAMMRSCGISYGLTQNMGDLGEMRFFIWGCVTDAPATFLKQIIWEWLHELEHYEKFASAWFAQHWVPFDLSAHTSVTQLLRDTDRAAYYRISTDHRAVDLQHAFRTVREGPLIPIALVP